MPSPIPKRKLVTQQQEDWKIKYLLTGKLPLENQENAFDLLDWRYPHPAHDPAKTLWLEKQGELLKAWLRANPGLRPFAWWQFVAFEPRKQIGGSGRPIYEALAYSKSFSFGVPNRWIGQIDADLHQDSQKVQNAVIDPDNPPIFEAQAAYLDRLGLLLDSEKPKSSFEPEALKIDMETGRLILD